MPERPEADEPGYAVEVEVDGDRRLAELLQLEIRRAARQLGVEVCGLRVERRDPDG